MPQPRLKAATRSGVPHPAPAGSDVRRPWAARPRALAGSAPAALHDHAQEQDVPKLVAWLVALAVFTSISRFHATVGALVAIRAPFILALLAIIMLATTTESWRPWELGKHWITRWIAIIAAIAIIGVPFSIYPGRSYAFLLDSYFRTLLLAVMTWAIARTPSGARFVAKTLVVAGVTAAVLAVRSGGGGRLQGAATYDANDLALVVVMTLPLALWWWFDARNKWRWFAAASVPLFLYVVVETDSRGGFLATAAVVLGLLLVSRISASRSLRKFALFVGLAAVATYPFLPESYKERVESITDEDDYNRTSPRGRKQLWTRGIGYAKERPLLGVGVSNFRTAEGRISERAVNRIRGTPLKWSAAHNSFLQVLAECGFIAGTLFALLILRAIYTLLFRGRRRTDNARDPPDLLAPMLGVSLFGFAVGGFFLSFAYYDILYCYLALAAAILMRPDVTGERGTPTPVPVAHNPHFRSVGNAPVARANPLP